MAQNTVKASFNEQKVRKEIEEMTRQELAKEANKLFSMVNKRIRRLKDSDTISPALEALQRKRGNSQFSSRGKNLQALQDEYVEALSFSNLQTSTVNGARQYTRELQDMLGDKIHDRDYISAVFDLMHGLEERLPVELASNMIGTNELLNEVIETAVGQNVTELNATTSGRNDFMQRAIDKLMEQLKGLANTSASSLESSLNSARSKVF